MTIETTTRRTHIGIALEYLDDPALARIAGHVTYQEYWLAVIAKRMDVLGIQLPVPELIRVLRASPQTDYVLPNEKTLRLIEVDLPRTLDTRPDSPDRIVAMFSGMSPGWVVNRDAVESFVREQVELWRRNSRYTESDVRATVQTIVFPHQYVVVQAFVELV